MAFPLATLAAQVTSAGISAPPSSDIYQSIQASLKLIYGDDFYVLPDSQDGQLLAAWAKSIDDCNKTAIAVYNSFSPLTAIGVGLSSIVKINGIRRTLSSNSQVAVSIVGQVGTVITNGVVKDVNKLLWNLPASVVIPPAGFVLVTATCQEAGAIAASPGQVNEINTPTLGWQSVTNPSDASQGDPVEKDPALRQRQARSVALPSLSILEGLAGALVLLVGVTHVQLYENDTDITDGDGLPPHSIAAVVSGGDSTQIAQTISKKKGPGAYTHGTTLVPVVDAAGVSHNIRYYIPTEKTITVVVSLHPLTAGYTATIGLEVRQAVVDYINALVAGEDVYRDRLFLPAQLYGSADSKTFNITNIQIAISPGAVGSSDLVIAFNEQATAELSDVTLTLV